MTLLQRLCCTLILSSSLSLAYAQSGQKLLNLSFTTIDAPGALNTVVESINSLGQMVGYYYNDQGFIATGFKVDSGNFTFFSDPIGYSTAARSINDSGLIAGYAYVGTEGATGFLYDGITFTQIQVGHYPDTFVEGLNNASDVVGGYGFGSAQGFERSGTKFRNVTPPGIQGTVSATAINNLGQIVGWSYDVNYAGFLYQNGAYQTINVPSSEGYTEAWGINDGGVIVGWYFGCTPSCSEHGFAFFKGKYLSFDFPAASGTFAFGINSLGQIVGTYINSQDGYYHGFVTSPLNAKEIR